MVPLVAGDCLPSERPSIRFVWPGARQDQPASDHAAGSMQDSGLLYFLPPSTPLHALLTNKLPLRARLGFLATRRSACFRRARTIHGGSRAARRLDRHKDFCGLSHTRRQHLAASCRGLRVYLECSAGSSSTSSPIVMVAPAPARRDHLSLIGTAHARLLRAVARLQVSVVSKSAPYC